MTLLLFTRNLTTSLTTSVISAIKDCETSEGLISMSALSVTEFVAVEVVVQLIVF